MTLTEFLLARIAEDEAVANAAARAAGYRWSPDPIPGREGAPAIDRHYATYDPARVLAECEAKRQTLRFAEAVHEDVERLSPDPIHAIVFTKFCEILAAVYADHPDYDEAWRP